jgi:ABC-type branched-subunit amino acid transport system permease subunit
MDVIGPYAATLAVYFLIYTVLTLGLNIQYGYTGILNFTYILFMALGAYIAGVTSLSPAAVGSGQEYILGWNLPFPIPLLLGGLGAGAVGALMGLVVFRRLRSDYLAVVTFALGFIAYDFVGNFTPLFDGFQGIIGVPEPWSNAFGLNIDTYTYFFVAVCAVIVAILWLISTRLQKSPVGRTLRAIREDSDQAEALGKNTFKYKMFALVLGCVYAGIGGALTIEFTGAMNPSGWTSFETFILFAALIVGGRGSNLGAVLGTLLFPTILVEGTRLLPQLQSNPELVAALRNVVIGAGLLIAMYLRPEGLIPEARHRIQRHRKERRDASRLIASGGVGDGG